MALPGAKPSKGLGGAEARRTRRSRCLRRAVLVGMTVIASACGSSTLPAAGAGSGTSSATTARNSNPTSTSTPASSCQPTASSDSGGQVEDSQGIRVVIPSGWDARISGPSTDSGGSVSGPFLIAANFKLPPGTGAFGNGAVESMRAGNVFVSLVEHTVGAVGTPLFARQGLPCPVTASSFDPNTGNPPVPGMGGLQAFFTTQGRAFVLYAVVGSYDNREQLVPLINAFLANVAIQPRP
jgi:hypothetical protein